MYYTQVPRIPGHTYPQTLDTVHRSWTLSFLSGIPMNYDISVFEGILKHRCTRSTQIALSMISTFLFLYNIHIPQISSFIFLYITFRLFSNKRYMGRWFCPSWDMNRFSTRILLLTIQLTIKRLFTKEVQTETEYFRVNLSIMRKELFNFLY